MFSWFLIFWFSISVSNIKANFFYLAARSLLYSLIGTGTEDFSIDSSSGTITVGRELHREEKYAEYNLMARAEDRGIQRACFSRVIVSLLDENNNPPL